MNLWAKRAGLLLSAAVLIFFISCEDDSFLLGIKGKPKFEGRYQEIVFGGEKSSVLLLDSVFTDQYALSADPVPVAAYRFILGEYNDPDLGSVRSELYAQFQPNNSPSSPPYFNKDKESLELDSITIQLLFDYYVYGPVQDMHERITVYELTDSLSFFERYLNSSTVPYNATPLGELTFDLRQIDYNLANDAGRSTRFYLKGTLGSKLDDDDHPGWTFAKRLFLYINSKGDSALVGENLRDFRKQFYGLAFVPSQSNRIIGYNPLHGSSQLTVHYQATNPARDSLTLPFYFTPYPYVSANAFNNITTSRIGDLQEVTEVNTPYSPASGKRYIQDGSTVITELDLQDFYNFIDTLDNIIINSAELSAEVVSPPTGMDPPSSLYAMLMKKTLDNRIVSLDMSVEEDSIKMAQFVNTVFTELTSFVISSELSNQSPLILSYNKQSGKYVGYATLFFQELFNKKDKPEHKIEHIGLYPATSPVLTYIAGRSNSVPILKSGVGNEVNRAILNSSGIKLKLYYTKPNLDNLK